MPASDATHKALTAAAKIGGDVHLLVAGENGDGRRQGSRKAWTVCPRCCTARTAVAQARLAEAMEDLVVR
jgi:electron transfer flavoprotein alpha subunit